MTSSREQAAAVADFHALTEQLPDVSLAEWKARVEGWKARMAIWVPVGELRQLIERCEALEAILTGGPSNGKADSGVRAKVISEPGSGIKITAFKLSEADAKALCTNGVSLPAKEET